MCNPCASFSLFYAQNWHAGLEFACKFSFLAFFSIVIFPVIYVFHHTAMITALDDGIASVVAALKANRMWHNTLFIFSSGELFGTVRKCVKCVLNRP